MRKTPFKRTLAVLLLAVIFAGGSSFTNDNGNKNAKKTAAPYVAPGTSQLCLVNYTSQTAVFDIVVSQGGGTSAPVLFHWIYSVPTFGVQYTPSITGECTTGGDFNSYPYVSFTWKVATPITNGSHKATGPSLQPIFGSPDGCKGLGSSTTTGGTGFPLNYGCGQYTYELYSTGQCL